MEVVKFLVSFRKGVQGTPRKPAGPYASRMDDHFDHLLSDSVPELPDVMIGGLDIALRSIAMILPDTPISTSPGPQTSQPEAPKLGCC